MTHKRKQLPNSKKCPVQLKYKSNPVTGKRELDSIDMKEKGTQEAFQEFSQKITGTANLQSSQLIQHMLNICLQGKLGNEEFAANSVIQMLYELDPKDPIEGMLCAQIVALYVKGMRYLSSSENSQTATQDQHYSNNAIKLLRLQQETIEKLMRYRRGGEQKVTVKHQYVQVNNGGQAIVGNIAG